jgi:hypothetical protein
MNADHVFPASITTRSPHNAILPHFDGQTENRFSFIHGPIMSKERKLTDTWTLLILPDLPLPVAQLSFSEALSAYFRIRCPVRAFGLSYVNDSEHVVVVFTRQKIIRYRQELRLSHSSDCRERGSERLYLYWGRMMRACGFLLGRAQPELGCHRRVLARVRID